MNSSANSAAQFIFTRFAVHLHFFSREQILAAPNFNGHVTDQALFLDESFDFLAAHFCCSPKPIGACACGLRNVHVANQGHLRAVSIGQGLICDSIDMLTFLAVSAHLDFLNVKRIGVWKVLRVLGSMLKLPGFEFETIEEVRAMALPQDIALHLSNATQAKVDLTAASQAPVSASIYQLDALVRRASALQHTADAHHGHVHG